MIWCKQYNYCLFLFGPLLYLPSVFALFYLLPSLTRVPRFGGFLGMLVRFKAIPMVLGGFWGDVDSLCSRTRDLYSFYLGRKF